MSNAINRFLILHQFLIWKINKEFIVNKIEKTRLKHAISF